MTNDEKKKYLETLLVLNNSINRDLDEIVRIRNRIGSNARYSRSRNINSVKVVSSIDLNLEKIYLKQTMVNKKIDRFVNLRLAIENKASALSDRRLSLLIKYRYVDGLAWNNICKKLYLSCESNQVFVLHSKALKLLDF